MNRLIFLLGLLIPFITKSQVLHVSATTGQEQLMSPNKAFVLGKEWFRDGENSIVIDNAGGIWERPHSLTIRKLDASGKELAINKLEDGEKVFGPTPSKVFEFDGRIYLIVFNIKEKPTVKVQISEIDRNTLHLMNTRTLHQFTGKSKGVLSIAGVPTQRIYSHASPDSSRMFFFMPVSADQLLSFVFEKGFSITRQKFWGMPKLNRFDIMSSCFDKEGNAGIVFSQPDFWRDETRYIYLQNNKNEDVFIDASSLEAGVELADFGFGINSVNKKVLGFADYKGTIEMDGVMLFEVDLTNLKLKKIQKIPYPDSFKRDVENCGFGDRKRGEYGIFPVSYWMETFEDGDVVLCGMPIADGNKGRLSVNTNKQFMWAGPAIMIFLKGKSYDPIVSMIPRTIVNVAGSYPFTTTYKDKLIVIYNDFAGALKREIKVGINLSSVMAGPDLTLAYAVVDKDGKIESRTIMAEPISNKNRYVPTNAYFINKHELLIPSSAEVDKQTGVKVLKVKIE